MKPFARTFFAAVSALGLLVATAVPARATTDSAYGHDSVSSTCGDGVVDAGEDCDYGDAACTYSAEIPDVIDCTNPSCTPDGADSMWTCTTDCRAVATCQPLLDDPAKMKFKMPTKLDFLKVDGRGIPSSGMDPAIQPVRFNISNLGGTIYSQTLPAGSMKPNKRHTAFNYKMKKNGTPMITNFVIRLKVDPRTGEPNYLFKVKVEGDLWVADPARNTSYEVDELARMLTMFYCGDDVFFVNTAWKLRPYGWFLADKYMTAN